MAWDTHSVFNQPRPLNNSNLFLSDVPLREALLREGAGWDDDRLISIGQQLGCAESLELGRLANANPPELLRFNSQGERLDEIRFHPAWHVLMQGLCANRLHNLPWCADVAPTAMVARAARLILHAQVEAGSLCPLTMTFAAIPLLFDYLPASFSGWRSGLLSDRYDPHLLPGAQKSGLLIGMGMTEKQGGTDVLINTSRAEPLARRGGGECYLLSGHKWFFSVPQSDAHLVLAQAKGGLSCFFLPRLLADGSRNALHIERLKDKLGNRANASSEVEFHQAQAWLIGEEGEGVRQILKMAGRTRLDCALCSHGLMRRAFSVALNHAQQRQVMGKTLVDQPLMTQLLSRQALLLEGQSALLLHLAGAWQQQQDPDSALLARLLTPAAKYVICQRGIAFVAEAMEVLGGVGYCEENELPRLYREMPVNSIWEGSGNVMCLDVLRVVKKQRGQDELLAQQLAGVRGANRHLDRFGQRVSRLMMKTDERYARMLTRDLLALATGIQLVKSLEPPLADAWCRQHLTAGGGEVLPATLCRRLLSRACGG
ncbi:isovaleryl-CoA dehydrogenase [Erwinia sp. OLTSP20]|uniref:isovaleryl-CoA dehydrogenase n=1 Tax=unclassified Erwinia TaxID=2622719 RepID=UPI000C189F15|nr:MULTISPECIES: isovaleryl-CoA dehydrogenase [unclassified Erwinia]PIJ52063.1 isovaleryl-CoA dehydrogenase [Erwinia sp. OAMSP11]PIJ75226.1 isovaleryl-CoA dehydrogenase [Erwinia sp. OLSSP12]PIJ84433.1 isovaleryl-CoA dehydrogenase [Erwinia sp. OLCASP19]PIJ87047.1 isovaleryl-CoA dehydrogenase [Erwinia sp. OLMTSP26]PIJ88611.1 isovaleryl-CoA dehydrogenase [Erwinia sp. OLMDSP33]